LECHDLESLTSLTQETGFRNGRRTHALHHGGATPNKYGMIKSKDGQTCFACHLPHTAHQEKLLRTEYQCTDTFCYTMRFMQNSVGGACVVGCHKPKAYSRTEGSEPRPEPRPGRSRSSVALPAAPGAAGRPVTVRRPARVPADWRTLSEGGHDAMPRWSTTAACSTSAPRSRAFPLIEVMSPT
jgi:hypothetical protein